MSPITRSRKPNEDRDEKPLSVDVYTGPVTRSRTRDRLSNLPDEILEHIVSRLTTKEAVRTCTLSKNWEGKWRDTSMSNVIVDDKEFLHCDRKPRVFFKKKAAKDSFYKFVEDALNHSENVSQFHVSIDAIYPIKHMEKWIFDALSRGVKTLKVFCGYTDIILPTSLYNSSSLINLELRMRSSLKTSAYDLPNLRRLCLYGVKVEHEKYSADLLNICLPKLEIFELWKCSFSGMNCMEFHVPKLMSFISQTREHSYDNYSIKIVSARLEKFECHGNSPTVIPDFDMSDAHVVCAKLNYQTNGYTNHGVQVRHILRRILSVEKLEISPSLMEALALSKSQRFPLFVYERLERLVLGCLSYVFDLLTVAPVLKFLDVTMELFSRPIPDDVPSCFLHSLEEVKFNNFVGWSHEFKLAKYVLEKAVKLKKVYVITSCYAKKHTVEERLSKYPKGSNCVTVSVS